MIELAEFWYNTSYHSAADIILIEATYGRGPPTLQQLLPSKTKAEAVAVEISTRDELLMQLSYNLKQAQQRMVKAANKHRRDVEFQVGHVVFLKRRPHRQTSMRGVIHTKLVARHFGPFRIVQKVGMVAYRLQLPEDERIHPAFHVSQLKRVVGNHPVVQEFAKDLIVEEDPIEPEAIIDKKTVFKDGCKFNQLLVKWKNHSVEEATWMDFDDFINQYPTFSLEDKVASQEGSVDRSSPSSACLGQERKALKVYFRRNVKGKERKGYAEESRICTAGEKTK